MKKTQTFRPISRRKVLTTAIAGAAGIALTGISPVSFAQADSPVPLDVYKDPTCGCCSNWIDQMDDAGFSSTIHHPRNLNAIKLEHGFVPQLQSCHTAITAEGYAFEGHVPPKHIVQFLANPPANAKGLTVPGMPMGSPGMEMGGRFTPYDIILLNRDGSTSLYARINRADEQY